MPPVGAQVTVAGMVRRPAIYEMRDEKSLADVLDLAGGILPAAALRHIEVQRLASARKAHHADFESFAGRRSTRA